MSTSSKVQQKLAITSLCDPENYRPIFEQCLTDKQRKKMQAFHPAAVMALTADMLLTHYDGIAEAFEKNNGMEITFKACCAQAKDEVKITFKPVAEVKDSASLNVPDPDQFEMDLGGKMPATEPMPKSVAPTVVEAEVIGLPAPVIGLPGPTRTPEEEQAYQEGRAAFEDGEDDENNPYRRDTPQMEKLYCAWLKGWNDAGESLDDLEITTREPLDLKEDLTDHEDEEGPGEEE